MMSFRRRLLPFAVALCTVLASARPASAYVRSVTRDSTPTDPVYLYWSSSCETVTIYLNGFTDMTSDEVAKSIGAAAAAWGPDQVTCPSPSGGHPYFQIIPQLSTGGSVPEVSANPKQDGKNSIIFVTSNWEGATNASNEAFAVTNVFREPSGKIVEADIVINADPLSMPSPLANLDPGVAPPLHGQARVDLQTVLTHEFGHFLGLAHPCVLDSGSGSDSDDEPTNAPSCTGADSTLVQAVMYPIIDSESITKRVLTPDDIAGVCAIYPPSADPHSCTENTPDDGCGCTAAGSGRAAALAPALAALALVFSGRRRRRR
jgi:MYXO-CTERM domain-containing protein